MLFMNDSVFLSQSYKDSQIDYERSLIRSGFPVWDYVVLTASNDEQAECFRIQIENRKVKGLLPKKTRFIVIPDENGVRVGSGGATLAVIRHIASIEKKFLKLKLIKSYLRSIMSQERLN